MEGVRFSIIVVCLNAGERLLRTVESVLEQSFGDYEIIVKDGLSTDGSVEKLPSDPRIRLYREKDSGIYDAMNQAVEKASGELLYFLNCGDLFHDGDVLRQVDRQVQEYERRQETGPQRRQERPNAGAGSCIFYGDIKERLTGERVSSNPHMDAFACYRNVPCHQACFYGRELMKRKKFDTGYAVRADYEHFLWCFFKGGAQLFYLPVLIADYEGGGFSETKKNRKRSAKEHWEITGKYMGKGRRMKYRLCLLVTLAPLRTFLSRNKVTARWYNRVKERAYRR